MIDQIIVPPSIHLWVGTPVLVSNSILFLLTGWLAWKRKAFTFAANWVFVLFQLSLMLQALVGIKLLDQGLGFLQLHIHYLGGLAPLAFCLLFYWLPTSDEYTKSRRVARFHAMTKYDGPMKRHCVSCWVNARSKRDGQRRQATQQVVIHIS